ncbi:hypothetical protein Droror1_Dr00014528 [Drosera rotundifolia]
MNVIRFCNLDESLQGEDNDESLHRPIDCSTVSKWIMKNSAESENMNWADRARISIMKEELFRLLSHEDLHEVYANKQDLKDALSPAEITDALSLHSIKDHD